MGKSLQRDDLKIMREYELIVGAVGAELKNAVECSRYARLQSIAFTFSLVQLMRDNCEGNLTAGSF